MGGGGVMRAAAKVSGIGVANSALRGLPPVSPAEHPIAAAARKATRPVSAILSSSDDGKSNAVTAPLQKPVWDDWEFAGGEDELLMDAGEPMPRIVFGGIPSMQEAKQATSELSDAVDKIYLSKSTMGEEPFGAVYNSGLSMLSNTEYIETKGCLTSKTTLPPAGALQAFRFLHESPAAQSVVASIACDPKVWDAVLQNEALTEFLQSQKTSASLTNIEAAVNNSFADAETQYRHYPESFDDSPKSVESGDAGTWFLDYLQDLKLTVVDMMSSLSDYFQSFFGAEKDASDDGSARPTLVDKALGASFMGLAVMVIMVVLLKRA